MPASKARQTSLGLAHAREASSSEPPSTERCAGLSTRRNISTGWASRWTDPTRAGTRLDALELECLWAKAVLSWHRSSAPLSSTPRSPPRRQSSRAGRAPGHHFTKEGQQPLPQAFRWPWGAPCGLRAPWIVAPGGRSNGRKSAGKGHGRTAGHRPVRGQILLLAKKKSRGVVGDHVGVVGSVCWSWKRLRARAGEVKNSCRFFGSDLPSGPGATGTYVHVKLHV